MFMRENRKINGAVQPEQTAASESAAQRKAQKLSPNEYPGEGPEDWRFPPSLETCAKINEDHYMGGVSGSGPYGKSYESDIPFVGNEAPTSGEGRSLKSR